jgi:hypothetical protein
MLSATIRIAATGSTLTQHQPHQAGSRFLAFTSNALTPERAASTHARMHPMAIVTMEASVQSIHRATRVKTAPIVGR